MIYNDVVKLFEEVRVEIPVYYEDRKYMVVGAHFESGYPHVWVNLSAVDRTGYISIDGYMHERIDGEFRIEERFMDIYGEWLPYKKETRFSAFLYRMINPGW